MRGRDRSILLLLLDGAADRPASELDGSTPLEAAETPNLDRLAAAGINGTMHVADPGVPLSSDLAHTRLFGYDPAEVPGRGVLEARGFGREPPAGSVVCSASFASLDAATGSRVADRHLAVDAEEFPALAERSGVASVDVPVVEGCTVEFEYTWKNRGLVTITADTVVSPAVTDVDPFEAGLPVVASEPTREAADPAAARRTADALQAYTRSTRSALANVPGPADAVLSKWAATPTRVESFRARHGLDAASVTPKPVLTGLARTLGMTHVEPPEGYDARADRALDALADHQFVHVHYPEPDEVSHAAGPTEKRDELSAIDASLSPVVERVRDDPDLVTVVTADHTTPSTEDVVHSGEPVPVTMVADPVRVDDVEAVGERPAARGGFRDVRGRELLKAARAAADRVMLDGLRRTPAVRDYPTGEVRPLWPQGE
ncbi:alkaline phosphatase family protein [Halobaculum halobium]|uniref:Alkaline phosphatase family protein n=1 Tax=Halobaculum halobium TaxID=3032281 RepID=A0ABD5T5U7_9EURY|nr:alkaline phosphatase family protein [Halobaculum sp. SYNS20]